MAFNILIVDDCSAMRFVIKEVLKRTGTPLNEVIEAADGKEALEWVRVIPFDLIITDLNMPNMTGAEFIAHLRVLPQTQTIPIITVTAESNTNRLEVISSLTSGFVHKPFRTEELREEMLSILRN